MSGGGIRWIISWLVDGGVWRFESWNGNRWTIVKSPNTSTSDSNSLYEVSCLSSSFCTAVGVYYGPSTSDYYQTLIESWDGRRWTIVPSPNPPPT
jgi:hypothetical protein